MSYKQKGKVYKQPTWKRLKATDKTFNHLVRDFENINSNGDGEETKMATKQKTNGANEEMKAFIQKLITESNQALVTTLTSNIRGEMNEMYKNISKEIKELDIKVDDIKKNQGAQEIRLSEHDDRISQLEKQIIQLQDQNRRNNVRIRGFAELPQETQKSLKEEIIKWLKSIVPEIVWEQQDIERIHRVTAVKRGLIPRDIIMRVANFNKKDDLMKAIRKSPGLLKYQENTVEIYNDLCRETINWRREMKPCIVVLQRAGIRYSWGYPIFLKFQWAGKFYRINSLEQGLHLLRNLKLMQQDERSEEGAAGGAESVGVAGVAGGAEERPVGGATEKKMSGDKRKDRG